MTTERLDHINYHLYKPKPEDIAASIEAAGQPIYGSDTSLVAKLDKPTRANALLAAASVMFTEYDAAGLPPDMIAKQIEGVFDLTKPAEIDTVITTANEVLLDHGIKTPDGLPVLDPRARRIHQIRVNRLQRRVNTR